MDNIEQLLKQPLPSVNDDHFTEQVMDDIYRYQKWRSIFLVVSVIISMIGSSIVLFLFVENTALLQTLNDTFILSSQANVNAALSMINIPSNTIQSLALCLLVTLFSVVAMQKGSQFMK
ncbi:hypothetical protein [Thalassotalea sediminis]|uniref:hypothetical protein n=1 Tax=Thalassotalea sediminis TaxID=1759089 RepID=UPI0025739D38|nr:hypothetical protein [Thalassotalea sediminis]